MVFDDSFEHLAANDGETARVVLAVQLLHPGLLHDDPYEDHHAAR